GLPTIRCTGSAASSFTRQLVFASVGVALRTRGFFIDRDWYRRSKRAIYVLMLGLMLLVFLVAEATRGSKRWIAVSFFRFHPSDFGKALFVLFIAAFLADSTCPIAALRTSLQTIALAAPLLI